MSKLPIMLLTICFISGRFTLERFGLSLNLELRYLIFGMFLISLFIVERKISNNIIRSSAYINLIIIIITVFTLSLSLTSIYVGDINIFFEKYIDIIFLFIMLLSFKYVLKYNNFEENLGVISTVFLVIGAIYLIPIIYSVYSGSQRGSISLGGPNVVTRVLFFSAVATFYKYKSRPNLTYLSLIIGFLAGIVLLGSRGGMVGAGSILSLYILILIINKKISLTRLIKQIRPKLILQIIFPIIIVYALWDKIEKIFIGRFVRLLVDRIYYAGRDEIYYDTAQLILSRPLFGYGLNAYKIETGGNYPHNIFLELFLELGVLGVCYYLIFFFISIFIVIRMIRSRYVLFGLLPLYMQVVALFSGDIFDFRYYFFWMFVLIYFLPDKDYIEGKVVLHYAKNTN